MRYVYDAHYNIHNFFSQTLQISPMHCVPIVVLLSSLYVTSQAFYVKSLSDEPTVRRLMLTSNARKSWMEIGATGGMVTQQLSKNYIIVLLLPTTRWKDTNATRLATNQNYLNVTEYAEAIKTFDLVNRPYEEDDTDIDSSETADDECPDGDCYLNEEDYTLQFEENNEEEDTVAEEKTMPPSRPAPPTKQSLPVTEGPPPQRNLSATKSTPTKTVSSSSSSSSSSPSSWVVEWHVNDRPTAKAMVSSGMKICLQTLTVTLGVLITLMRIISL